MPKGLYCANFGGGQVDITSGNFVFSASESYLIEDGKLTRPVRNATLIGNGPEALKYVSMVGNDLQARRRHRRLRQGRPERARRRRHPDHQDRPHDRGRHRLSARITCPNSRSDVVKQALDGRRHRRRVHHRRRRGVLRQRAHARARKSEGSRLARRRPAHPDRQAHGLVLHLRPFARRHRATWCNRPSNSPTSPPKIRTPACPTPTNWARSPAICSSSPTTSPSLTPASKIDAAKRAEAAALAADPRITNSEGASFDSTRGRHVFANSRGFRGEYRTSYCSLSAVPVATRRRVHGARLLVHDGARLRRSRRRPEYVGRIAAERALRRLDAVKVETQKVPVIFEPRTAALPARQHLRSRPWRVDLPPRVVPRGQTRREGRRRERSPSIDDGTIPGLFGSRPSTTKACLRGARR